MFIDGVVIVVALLMATKSLFLQQHAEFWLWFIVWLYAIVNLAERRLKGSDYDY